MASATATQMTPDEVRRIFQGQSRSATHEDGTTDISDSEIDRRTRKLEPVTRYLKTVSDSQEGVREDIALEIGIGSRDPSWRSAIGRSGLLDYFVDIVTKGVYSGKEPPRTLAENSFRIIGNSCADNDDNRRLVVDSKKFADMCNMNFKPERAPFVLPAIYNIMANYQPAVDMAQGASLSFALISLLGKCGNDTACTDYIVSIMDVLQGEEEELLVGPPSAPSTLLAAAVNLQQQLGLKQICDLYSIALLYLTKPRYHKQMIADLRTFLAAFKLSYTHWAVSQAASDPELAARLEAARTAFVQVLAELSAHDDFLPLDRATILHDPVFNILEGWLEVQDTMADIQLGAFLALGNLARSDAMSKVLVEDARIHVKLIHLLTRRLGGEYTDPASLKLIHAMLGFARNLAIPVTNKRLLHRLLKCSLVPSLYKIPTARHTPDGLQSMEQQVELAAMSLTRLLLTNSPENARMFCNNAGGTAPQELGVGADLNESTVAFLKLATCFEHTKEWTSMRIEAARVVLATCRCTYIPHEQSDTTVAGGVAMPTPHPDVPSGRAIVGEEVFTKVVVEALSWLVAQTQYANLRSEALFVLALMARREDASEEVLRILRADGVQAALKDVVLAPLPAAAAGAVASSDAKQSAAEPSSRMQQASRENGLSLVSLLLEQQVDKLTAEERSGLEQLVMQGTALLQQSRSTTK